ncbi:MAG TPA: tetratricopeptide repeat protein [Bryobacteraceae bacterium]|nr:tetratricopeptide repeat protein [Bryobacteraceae bacterium]
MPFRVLLLTVLCPAVLLPADTLSQAYEALRSREYARAISLFETAIKDDPGRVAVRKDLAYTYLKIGENELARDQFAEAMKIDTSDHHVALEYAFLCFETKRQADARRVFDRVRKNGDAASRATAEQAFQNIDRPLAEGIARWEKALELSPDNFSAHRELAELAEQRDEPVLAAEHYEKAWRLRPDQRSLMLALGRVWKQAGRVEEANALLLAASRGAEPRTAEAARELLPARYPYVYEFRRALTFDPQSVELRRELAYLLLEMGEKSQAEEEFDAIVKAVPEDLLSSAQLGFLRLQRGDSESAMPLLDKVLKNADEELADRVRMMLKLPQTLRRRPETPKRKISIEAKTMGERSYEAGYLKDALKYLKIANENDPLDFSVMLKLGWANNLLHQDKEALQWFSLARSSPDPAISAEARRAHDNLRPALARVRTTAWLFPMYSSRWRDLFSYGQIKTDVRLGKLPFRPYLSTRFIGDTRRTTGGIAPQYLSESSFIVGVGVATNAWHGALAWAEAGTAVSYLSGRKDTGGRFLPDYRGGVAFGRGFGMPIGGESHGTFFETNEDAVFVSRFNNDLLFYTQNRAGYTLPAFGPLRVQLYWNANLTADARRQHWANFAETGPGLRFRFDWMPESLVFSTGMLRGFYMMREGNPHGSHFTDFRAGFWYAFTR